MANKYVSEFPVSEGNDAVCCDELRMLPRIRKLLFARAGLPDEGRAVLYLRETVYG